MSYQVIDITFVIKTIAFGLVDLSKDPLVTLVT